MDSPVLRICDTELPSLPCCPWSPSPFITSVFTLLLLISSWKARLPTYKLALFVSEPLNVMFPVQKFLFLFPFFHLIMPKSHFPSEASQAVLLLTFMGPQGKSNRKKVNHHLLPKNTHHTPSTHRVLSLREQGWPQNTAEWGWPHSALIVTKSCLFPNSPIVVYPWSERRIFKHGSPDFVNVSFQNLYFGLIYCILCLPWNSQFTSY